MRQRVLRTAVALADAEGLGAVSMRKLAAAVGVEAMSLYHHVANKEDVLDGLAEQVMLEVYEAVGALPETPDDEWRTSVRLVVLTARKVLLRHPWAPPVLDTRVEISLASALHFERLLGHMRRGGLSWDLAHRGLHALGSRALGYSHELFAPAGSGGTGTATDDEMPDLPFDLLPNLTGMITHAMHEATDPSLGWCDTQSEFEFALDLVLDGLEARRIEELDRA